MGSERAVVEISSDDEDLYPEKWDSFDWVSDLLDRDDIGAEDVDDVMVVDEFSVPPAKPTQNSESWRPARGAAGDESDDDCLVLDSDPDNPVSVVDDKGSGGHGSDDLLILGEKGQLACRDFPHPRHLCANFPFSTTRHEKHCKLCHCYVCDSPAPCIYWGNGIASTDHCHSTDKDGRWKALRQSFKQKSTTFEPQKLLDTTLSMLPSFQNSVPPCRSNTSSLSIPLSRSNPLRPCSATRCATPDPANRIHHQNSAPLSYLGQRPGHHASKSHPLNPRTQCIQRQNRVAGALTAQSVYSQTRFKRVGTARSGPMSLNENRLPCSALNNNQLQRNVLQGYHFTPVTSRRTQCPPVTSHRSQRPPGTLPQSSHSAPVTSQISQCPPVTSVDDSVNQMYKTALQKSQCVPVRSQSSPCPTMTLVNDDTKSWQDMLASVASELGVFDSNSREATPDVQQPLMVSSQPQPFSQFVSETNVSQDVDICGHSAPEVTNLNSLGFDCGWENPAAQSIPENAQGVDSQLKDVQPSDSLVSGCNQGLGDSRLGSILAFLEEEMVAEGAKEPGQPELDPVTLLYDFEATWSSLPPV
ncbi:uncharacterized protein LOC120108571 [Phoenix dactylifera]|uniref:Uncharacterized protein LOC103703887 n=1 Tax=Phoenix dactylifera TaxID=42345 RepID=A0A8B7BTP7_PHODC|nr:uncharacterized protein LOC103703887 [Phoenix dactylifera]XP_038978138.1 uncharacterized protein LOC120108571 [Phoenix dactylifera]